MSELKYCCISSLIEDISRWATTGNRSLQLQYTYWIYFLFSQIYLKSFSIPGQNSLPDYSLVAQNTKTPEGVSEFWATRENRTLDAGTTNQCFTTKL